MILRKDFLVNKLIFILIIIFYKLSLDFVYVNFISKLFEYEGYSLNFNFTNYIFSVIIVLFLGWVTPYSLNKVSDWFLFSFYILLFIPITTMYSFNQELSFFPIVTHLLTYFIIYFMLKMTCVKVIRVSNVLNGRKIFVYVNLFMIIYLLIWYFYTGAIKNINFDLSKVYDFRDLNSSLTNIGFASYLNNWVYKLSSLALMGYGFLRKNMFIILFSMITQLIFFGVSAHKSVLFSGFMILGIYLYLKITNNMIFIPLFLGFLIIMFFLFSYKEENIIYSSIFIRRLLFVPAKLAYDYYDFFQQNTFSWWSTSIFSNFIDTPYTLGIDRAIGNYLGTPDAYMNNGFVSSGYAQAGILGVLIYAIIVGWILKFIDYLIIHAIYPLWFGLVIVSNPLISLILSSDLFAVILTHGLALSILFLVLLNNRQN